MKVTIEEKITFSRIPFHTVLRGDCAKIRLEDSLNITIGQGVRVRDGSKILLAFGNHLSVQKPKDHVGSQHGCENCGSLHSKIVGG
jgi:hypothetical protein